MFYVIFVVILGVICFTRIVCLFRRVTWRNSLDGEFPTACGEWATNGCTRVVLPTSGCVNAEDLVYENTIVINTAVDNQLNKAIASCVGSVQGGKLMSPDNLADSKDNS